MYFARARHQNKTCSGSKVQLCQSESLLSIHHLPVDVCAALEGLQTTTSVKASESVHEVGAKKGVHVLYSESNRRHPFPSSLVDVAHPFELSSNERGP